MSNTGFIEWSANVGEDDVTTRYVPIDEPWRSKWCVLHAWHIVALAHMDVDTKALCAAPYLADAKYKLWLQSKGYK